MDRRVTRLPARSTGIRVILMLSGACLGASPAARGQIAGLPMHFSPSAQPGLRLHADFAAGDRPFETYLGGRATLNLAVTTFTAGVGSLGGTAVWGGTAAANLLRGGARHVSVSVDVGFGAHQITVLNAEFTTYEIPIGVGLAYEASVTGIDLEPWMGVRLHVRRTSPDDAPGGASGTTTGGGLSAGVNVRSEFIANFGLHVAADYLTIGRLSGGGRDGTLLLNIGINYLIPFAGFSPHGIIRPACSPFDPC